MNKLWLIEVYLRSFARTHTLPVGYTRTH